jgi:hypothetical protein
MNSGDWQCHTPDQLPAAVMIVPVICVSDRTHLTKFSDKQHAWPPCLTIGIIRKEIRWTPEQRACILVRLI